jgi:hypothetical protein
VNRPREWVAIIMAIGLSTAVNAITVAVLIDALYSQQAAGLSENATQILTTAFGGMIGVLGSYIGYRSARAGIDADQQNAVELAATEHQNKVEIARAFEMPPPARAVGDDDDLTGESSGTGQG